MTAPSTGVQAGASAPVLRWAAAPIWAALLAAAAFIGMDATVKGMTPRYGALQLTFFRFASGLVFAVGLWAWWRTPMPTPGQWRMHLLRSALLLVTLGLYFHALSVLALAQTVAMGYTAPIFISLLAMLLLRERPSRWIWGALALGFLGAGAALWPELQRSGRPQLAGLLSAAGSAVCFAFVMVLTRRQAQHDALPTFMLMQNLLPVLMLAVPVSVVWLPVPASELPAIAAIGALATVGLSAIAWALRHMEASRLAPVEYTGFVWAALVGYVAFGEVPTVYTAGSALLIVAGCLLLLRR